MKTKLFLVPHGPDLDPLNPYSSAYEKVKADTPLWEADGDLTESHCLRRMLKDYKDFYGLRFDDDELLARGRYQRVEADHAVVLALVDPAKSREYYAVFN